MKLQDILETVTPFRDLKDEKKRKLRREKAQAALKKAKETGKEIEVNKRRREMKSVD